MLCSSRTGLDDVLSCNAATGTAIAASEKLNDLLKKTKQERQMFPPGLWSVFIGSSGKFNRDQLLTHWSPHRSAPSQQQKKKKPDDTRWLPAASTAHQNDPEVSVTEVRAQLNWKCDCLRYYSKLYLNSGYLFRAKGSFKCFVDLGLNWDASSAYVTTSFQTCAVLTASFVWLLPATAN